MFVSNFNDWVIAAYERYTFCKKLISDSENDPVTNPYYSKYQASTILKELCVEIEKKWISHELSQIKLLYALFNYEIGLIALETEEKSAGCDALNTSLDYLKTMTNTPEGCHLTLKVLNQLGILWSERGENIKALDYLLQAENIYNNYKSSHETCPYDFEDMFIFKNDKIRDWAAFEETFTYTLYYLAQVYEMTEENDKAAKYCRETLKRQRENGVFVEKDWGLNCATLSQYYVKSRNFKEARHLLCAASCIVMKSETDEELQQVKASISSNWVNYSIAVLEPCNLANENQSLDRLMNDENILKMESEIPVSVSTFEEAKIIFIFAANHIKTLKQYYAFNEYASNHVQIVRNYSSLYKYLSCYEPDASRKCKMCKRRMDMLENVLEHLNPKFYLPLCRQLQFELGEICYEMMDYKLKLLSNIHSQPSSVKKVNLLINKSIGFFDSFINSFNDNNGKVPDTFSEDNVRPVLIAHFYLGRLYTKMMDPDTNRILYYLSKSEEYYKFIVQYIEQNPNHSSHVEKELPIVNEMIQLMPERMAQVTNVLF